MLSVDNKNSINQWTSNKKSQMSPETLANTEFTNLKSVHIDHQRSELSDLYFLKKNKKCRFVNVHRSAFLFSLINPKVGRLRM